MKNLLFPHQFKRLTGWLFYIFLIIGAVYYFFFEDVEIITVHVPNLFGINGFSTTSDNQWIRTEFMDELLTIFIVVFGLIHCFSKEPIEDELIAKIRLGALAWSVFLNYTIVLLANLVLFEDLYFDLLIFNLFNLLLFFNLRFRYVLNLHYNSSE